MLAARIATFEFGWLPALAVLLAACATPPPALPPGPLVIRVDVAKRSWHTDLCLAAGEMTGRLARVTGGFADAHFYCFGFGERQFLLHQDRGIVGMMSALLPSRAAVLMTVLRTTPADAFGAANVVTLAMSRAGAGNLKNFLWTSLETAADGLPVRLRDGFYPGSVFFAASGTYDALATCNTWTATGLRSAGLPVSDAVIFAGQVMSQVRRTAAAQASGIGR
jgi:uncharacterized protein (TIGR02117 family)